MLPIAKPLVPTSVVFADCIRGVRNELHKQNLEACTTSLMNAAADFETKFIANQIYLIAAHETVVTPIGKADMIDVYNNGMVKSTSGRIHYDSIKASAKDDICPLCSIRPVDTLDHYLPKALYPIFAVTPINLVPSCTPCNKGKLISFPTSASEQTLNPYYDNVNNTNWIKARVLQTTPVAVSYYADPPTSWDPILKSRVSHHFTSYNLHIPFAAHGNRRLQGDLHILKSQKNISTETLKQHLYDSFQSNLVLGPNSVEAVLFNSLFNDDWFCNVGVTL